MDFNLNSAQGLKPREIPKGTILPLMVTIQAGGDDYNGMHPNDAGLSTATKSRDANMLKFEFVVMAGDYAKFRIWDQICCNPNGSESHEKWMNMSRDMLRTMIESAHGISPDDESDNAMQIRSMLSNTGLKGLQGLTFTGESYIEKDEQYGDKTRVRPITVDNAKYKAPMKLEGGIPPIVFPNGYSQSVSGANGGGSYSTNLNPPQATHGGNSAGSGAKNW